MRRLILIYGLASGLLIAALQYAEYRFLVLEHSLEIYGAIVGLVFVTVGIRLGQTLTKPREVTVVKEVPVPAPFVRDDRQVAALGLTPREIEILERIAAGLSTREIAAALYVSENTVKTHASRLFDKLDVRRRTQAVETARRLRIIP